MTVDEPTSLRATLACTTRSITDPCSRSIVVRVAPPCQGAPHATVHAETHLTSGPDIVVGTDTFDIRTATMIEYSQLARACRWTATTSRADVERHVERARVPRPTRTFLSQFCDIPGAAFCLKHEPELASRVVGVSIDLFMVTVSNEDLVWRRFRLRAMPADLLCFAAELERMYEALDLLALNCTARSEGDAGA